MANFRKKSTTAFHMPHNKIRKSFGTLLEIESMPNLIEVQKASYRQFLQSEIAPKDREDVGLQAAFKSIFPIHDFAGNYELHFESYFLEPPKYDVNECRQRGMTYDSSLRMRCRLVVYDTDEDTKVKSVREIKEQDVYMADVPLMTKNGTFIINGTERVVVSQMHRSPGVFFDHDGGKSHPSGKYLFSARIIPYRGSWLDFEFDTKDILNVRIDRRRKIPVTTFLMALEGEGAEQVAFDANGDKSIKKGMNAEDILSYFYDSFSLKLEKGTEGSPLHWSIRYRENIFKDTIFPIDLLNKKGDIVVPANTKVAKNSLQTLAKTKDIFVTEAFLYGKFLKKAIVSPETGEVLAAVGDMITEDSLKLFEGIEEISIVHNRSNRGLWLCNTLAINKCKNRVDALIDIQNILRPGEPATGISGLELFENMFFNKDNYDLSAVGRVKINTSLNIPNDDVPDTVRTLRKEDMLGTLKILLDLKDGIGSIDDIDHLGNRRVRSVGELLEQQYRLGLARVERTVKERMSLNSETMMPNDLVVRKPISAIFREFFGSSQLSQFMDQTNPLSEITHKRRLSALGPGGLSRDRAGFEVRDVHPTHYGRICPIETPEGPNIGLISSLANYARINKYGFIETPYRKVKKGRILDEIVHLTATDEDRHTIAQANTAMKNGKFRDKTVSCRSRGEYVVVDREDVDLMDLSPKQVFSVASSLIPFLENDDANRALMGANMQRQALPLLQSEAPLVGTGMEAKVAIDSGVSITAKRSGIIDQVDAKRIVVRATGDIKEVESGVDIYTLSKYQRSNQNSCINQRPLVKVGDRVKKDQILADGHSTDKGELALGRNVLVAFMPWNGYNFEDSILVSDRLVRDDVYTSVHIEEFEVKVLDTRLGQEEITRELPNVGEEVLKNLDETGIVYVGSEVKAGDILVGKVTPKVEKIMTPEEKLVRAVFDQKASNVRDSSLRVTPGNAGTVVEVRVFNRRGVEKDARALAIEEQDIKGLIQDRDDEIKILQKSFRNRLGNVLVGQEVLRAQKGLNKGLITLADVEFLSMSALKNIVVASSQVNERIAVLKKQFEGSVESVKDRFKNKVEKVYQGDEMSPGVMRIVKVFVAQKRKLQPGDKMAGRHGNKGVISAILPVQDMPHLEDGTPVDVVLNPVGVSSRMNVGQILETHLGWASVGLGRQVAKALEQYTTNQNLSNVKESLRAAYDDENVSKALDSMSDEDVVELAHNVKQGIPMATPIFDGATEKDIDSMLRKSGMAISGQERLIDGRTGEYFDFMVTVGCMYVLKLHHLVDDKLHARSTGPYSLVTQQPLGGKAQFGGQRFGEMEVWALEAYGAAYTLQEMLTVKSDDVSGRTKVYESILRGDSNFVSGTPESFNVLVREMRALGLDLEMRQEE